MALFRSSYVTIACQNSPLAHAQTHAGLLPVGENKASRRICSCRPRPCHTQHRRSGAHGEPHAQRRCRGRSRGRWRSQFAPPEQRRRPMATTGASGDLCCWRTARHAALRRRRTAGIATDHRAPGENDWVATYLVERLSPTNVHPRSVLCEVIGEPIKRLT